MTRVLAIVEGQTEERFVKDCLAPELSSEGVYLRPVLLGRPGHKGGRTTYVRVKADIIRLLKQDKAAFCSTMIDYYGLGRGFPGAPPPANLTSLQKVEHIEQAIRRDICSQLSEDLRPDVRLIPYLSLHEYEALLFSDPDAFAEALHQPGLSARFRQTREAFLTPEDIDDGPSTAPSKRVLAVHPSYRKVIDGTLAAQHVSLARMLEECPHFRAWFEQLKGLGTGFRAR